MSAARLGRYELGEIIGTGGVAEAWRASYGGEQFRKTVVVKRVRPELREHTELHDAFLREARVAQRLQHGNVVQVLDVGDDDGVPFIVLEHVDGCSLQVLLDRVHTLPIAVALHVAEQIALALQHAHAAHDEHGLPLQLVHRDVTPGNVLLSKDGVVKLSDFGIARVHTMGSDTLPGFVKGTPIYLAPEQAAGRAVDARADVYSLGLVLRRMLVGDGELAAIDPELAAIVEAATEPAVRDRLPSAAALLAQLQRYRNGHGIDDASAALAHEVRASIGEPQRRALAIDAGLRDGAAPATRQITRPIATRRRWLPIGALLVLALATAALAWPDISPPVEPEPTTVAVPSEPARDPPPAVTPRDPPARAPTVAPPAIAATKPTVAKKPKGRLEVQNLVPWAEVFVDDKPWGRAPQAKPLAAGTHRVRLYNPDAGESKQTIVIEAGETKKIAAWPR